MYNYMYICIHTFMHVSRPYVFRTIYNIMIVQLYRLYSW